MFSQRRRAQLGLLSASLLLILTLTILYQGSRDGARQLPDKSGQVSSSPMSAIEKGNTQLAAFKP
jgi:hypothetical protein